MGYLLLGFLNRVFKAAKPDGNFFFQLFQANYHAFTSSFLKLWLESKGMRLFGRSSGKFPGTKVVFSICPNHEPTGLPM